MNKLVEGLKEKITFIVEEKHLAVAMGSGDARVFATPMLIAGMEAASVAIAKPCLQEGQSTVGVHVNVYHNAATPLGMRVTFEAELVKISGRKLGFKVRAFDEAGPIGEGEHERVIVGLEEFEKRAKAKKS